MGVFDIIGPVMIGPSSSHTAGAARLGKMARTILGESPVAAKIKLYGSFARTYLGHGTDKALVAGLLGLAADDQRIKQSLELAKQGGLAVTIETAEGGDIHPNTVEFNLTGASGRQVRVVGISTGGGNVLVNRIDDFQVEISGDYYTLITVHQDKPGIIALVTKILAQEEVNIAFMRVSRTERGSQAMMIVEADQYIPQQAIEIIDSLPAIESALVVQPL